MKTYYIYCDESIKNGEFFSNFYGGALVDSKNIEQINSVLNAKKNELNLNGEIKWSKMTEAYLEKYMEFIELYFSFIKNNLIKIRIMFLQNINRPRRLTEEQKNNEYFLLYYQFFKHAFGLAYCGASRDNPIRIIPFFDQFPDTKIKVEKFKDFITSINFFQENGIIVNREDIAEIDSKNHVIQQGMDIILGSMQFRLNKEHLRVDPATHKRGKRTRAKEKLYKFIYSQISDIFPNFNIGISTGYRGSSNAFWEHPYRHWSFKPNE